MADCVGALRRLVAMLPLVDTPKGRQERQEVEKVLAESMVALPVHSDGVPSSSPLPSSSSTPASPQSTDSTLPPLALADNMVAPVVALMRSASEHDSEVLRSTMEASVYKEVCAPVPRQPALALMEPPRTAAAPPASGGAGRGAGAGGEEDDNQAASSSPALDSLDAPLIRQPVLPPHANNFSLSFDLDTLSSTLSELLTHSSHDGAPPAAAAQRQLIARNQRDCLFVIQRALARIESLEAWLSTCVTHPLQVVPTCI